MSLVRLLETKTVKTLFTTPSHSQKGGIYQPLKDMYKIDISETECQECHNCGQDLFTILILQLF